MDIYFSVDVESNGPIPGPNSMLSFGAAAFLAGNKTPIDTFEVNLVELAGSTADPSTAQWWAHPDQKSAWEACRKDPQPPLPAMNRFVGWVEAVVSRQPERGVPVFVAYPAGYDFLFVYWYLMKFVGKSPFSFSALDIKSFAMPILGTLGYRECVKKNWPKRWFKPSHPHTHIALDDAIGQGIMFLNMLEDVKRLHDK